MTVNAVNTYIVPTTANEVTMPSQPAFCATMGADANRTGAGAIYVIGTNTAYTERFDQNSDFNTNGTFTAPVDGRYRFDSYVSTDAANTSTEAWTRLNTSDAFYFRAEFQPDNYENTAGGCGVAGTILVNMDAADTAVMQIAYAAGANDVDIRNTTWFSGNLEV